MLLTDTAAGNGWHSPVQDWRSVIATTLASLQRTQLVFLRPGTLWIRSIAGSLSVLCNFYALSHLPVSDALTLTNMFPVWIAVLSWPFLGRFPERDVWLSVGCSICGVMVMQQSFPTAFGPGMLAAMTGSVTRRCGASWACTA
jgi:drug/metabolite transporter (DMT)-like permease